jgi:DNA-binding protein H-NS
MKKTKTYDFVSISSGELWAVHLEVATVLARKIAAEKTQLENRLRQLQSIGFANGDAPRQRRPYPQVVPKYRNPAKPAETWAGRGKQPRWLKAQLKAGKNIDDFRIGNASRRSTRASVKAPVKKTARRRPLH